MNTSGGRSVWSESVLAACLYFVLTLALAYPLTRHPGASVLAMDADTNLTLWTVAWDAHALVHAPLSIFDANIYYPFRHTLAYSENHIGSAAMAAPVLWITHNPVLALNVVSLASCVLCGVGAYVLARRVGIGRLGALLSGLIFAFAPPRFFRLTQLQMAAVQWLPFCLAFLHGYLDAGRRRDLWWACAFFSLQAVTSGHGAVFTAISVVVLFLWRVALGEPIALGKRARDVGVVGVGLLALGVIVFIPYRAVQNEMGLRRPLEESDYFSRDSANFVASPTYIDSYLMSKLTRQPTLNTASAYLFPGFLPLLLAVVGAWKGLGSRRERPKRSIASRLAFFVEGAFVAAVAAAVALTITGGFRLRLASTQLSARQPWRAWVVCGALAAIRMGLAGRAPLDISRRARGLRSAFRSWSDAHRCDGAAFYTVLVIMSCWLALGPSFGLYRLVYDLPGLSFIRVPSRYTVIALLALSVLAAAGFDRLTARLPMPRRLAACAVTVGLLIGEFFAAPLRAVPYRVDIPKIDRWLATRPTPLVVAELPLPKEADIDAFELQQSLFMLHSTAHWQKTIHGYSGMRPALHTRVYSELSSFPNEAVLGRLASLGVTHIVVHTDLYPPTEWPSVEARLDGFAQWLTVEHVEVAGRIYWLHRPPLDVLLRACHNRLAAALAVGDVTALAAMYADDAVVVTAPGSIVRGRDAIAEWRSQGERYTKETSSNPADVVVAREEGYIGGRFTEGRPADSRSTRGSYLEVWKFIGGEWKLWRDIYNEDSHPVPARR
jgi:ketosteroid isomerase-like protein